ncbi:phosphonate-transporting ATPase [Thermoclostridium stercorarium subsp. stercorarium DSM 8532]|jgi:putative ABC transport system ATP-binding protein|uniref:Phosphonate-transporting ATPase n=3 Tax=Thermoclostridium stercorarium TaxID=1510 RepID=L7VII3_THES1|nr:ABC transporter ATP-binding protein [Thermoclostridium stercorarium]AGC67870.1 phosphonate-transporting ATPase [Thermoclostridium stercorarium subsp. stercorarium DSM 8532]AGI38911.1 ABC transporter ATPase subunit [Thermoclostridium stercorarium subsp. stercorarium DSM 8532]ANW98280.1 macrolide ABC transporter ATP-binding protein [Thermoclostridium stercorarium subsp. thermolacticum DSM 2910]ANX00804.1 macrolide ABC transporter ATP-binding protein [Thermoclostridium stercorarium subsp. lepto
MENVIVIKDLKKVYRMGQEKVYALNGIDLEVKKGEICCLFGTSGSGKTTLLNMVAGLEKPTKGSVIVKGIHVEKLNEKQLAKFRQQYIGFIFQSYNLLPNMTALENVTLPLIFKGYPKKLRTREALKMLKAVGLEHRVNHKPNQMSGGQQQRVSIARAFVEKPEIILADEPTGNLDSKTTIEIMNLISEMAEKYGQTILIVSHDTEAAAYADRIVHMRDGMIEKIEVKDKYYKKFGLKECASNA